MQSTRTVTLANCISFILLRELARHARKVISVMELYKTTPTAPMAYRTQRSVFRAIIALQAPTTPQSTRARQGLTIQEPDSRPMPSVRHALRGSTARQLGCRHQQAIVRQDISVSKGHQLPHPLTELREIYVRWDHTVRQAPTVPYRVLLALMDQ